MRRVAQSAVEAPRKACNAFPGSWVGRLKQNLPSFAAKDENDDNLRKKTADSEARGGWGCSQRGPIPLPQIYRATPSYYIY